MFEDANEYSPQVSLQADVCVVGGGAAGITLALALIDSGLRIVLLESGGFKADARTQALYAGHVADERLHSPPDRYRQRRFGGTTTIWGGRCVPFDPVDFEVRNHVPFSGWPLTYSDLESYYPHANTLCEAGAFAYTIAEAFDRPIRPMIDGFTPPNFSTDTLERFSCPTDFGSRYRKQLADAHNVRVVLHANVTELCLTDDTRRVTKAKFATLTGVTGEVTAERFVVAAGGLETARLLLASRDSHGTGIGNRYDVVGRYYMCHIAGTIGSLRINRPTEAVWHGYEQTDDGVYCRRRFAVRTEAQHRERIANVVARLHHPRITDPGHGNAALSALYLARFLIPYEYAKRLFDENPTPPGTWLRHAGNVVTGFMEAIGFAIHMLRDRLLAKRKFPSIIVRSRANTYSLDVHAEQEPNPASRVTLNDSLDEFGMPRLTIDWRYTPGDIRSVRRMLELLAADLVTSGAGQFTFDPDSVEAEMTRYGAYGGHHIGTARMGTDPRTSVVDATCRVHDVDNLYIAGAAVFPTSSQANPTLTIVALALRLATTLREASSAAAR